MKIDPFPAAGADDTISLHKIFLKHLFWLPCTKAVPRAVLDMRRTEQIEMGMQTAAQPVQTSTLRRNLAPR